MKFAFTRLQYDSGDWVVDQRMPSNLLNSLIEYTTIPIDPEERVVSVRDPAMLEAPFTYLAGHKLVEFDARGRDNIKRYVDGTGEMEISITKVDASTGEFAGVFTAIQPSDTDMGSKDPLDVKITGQVYGRLEQA